MQKRLPHTHGLCFPNKYGEEKAMQGKSKFSINFVLRE